MGVAVVGATVVVVAVVATRTSSSQFQRGCSTRPGSPPCGAHCSMHLGREPWSQHLRRTYTCSILWLGVQHVPAAVHNPGSDQRAGLRHQWSDPGSPCGLPWTTILPSRVVHGHWTSSHMSKDPGTFSSYCPSSKPYSSRIVVANGSTLPILGKGICTLRTPHRNFTLRNILHTPNLVKNSLYVRKVTTDNSCSVEFDQFSFSVKDLLTRIEIMRSNSSGDLYPFESSSMVTSASALATYAPSSDVWHCRLGTLAVMLCCI